MIHSEPIRLDLPQGSAAAGASIPLETGRSYVIEVCERPNFIDKALRELAKAHVVGYGIQTTAPGLQALKNLIAALENTSNDVDTGVVRRMRSTFQGLVYDEPGGDSADAKRKSVYAATIDTLRKAAAKRSPQAQLAVVYYFGQDLSARPPFVVEQIAAALQIMAQLAPGKPPNQGYRNIVGMISVGVKRFFRGGGDWADKVATDQGSFLRWGRLGVNELFKTPPGVSSKIWGHCTEYTIWAATALHDTGAPVPFFRRIEPVQLDDHVFVIVGRAPSCILTTRPYTEWGRRAFIVDLWAGIDSAGPAAQLFGSGKLRFTKEDLKGVKSFTNFRLHP